MFFDTWTCLVLVPKWWIFEMAYFVSSHLYLCFTLFRLPISSTNYWHPADSLSLTHIFFPMTDTILVRPKTFRISGKKDTRLTGYTEYLLNVQNTWQINATLTSPFLCLIRILGQLRASPWHSRFFLSQITLGESRDSYESVGLV